jgi:hypothetical protein
MTISDDRLAIAGVIQALNQPPADIQNVGRFVLNEWLRTGLERLLQFADDVSDRRLGRITRVANARQHALAKFRIRQHQGVTAEDLRVVAATDASIAARPAQLRDARAPRIESVEHDRLVTTGHRKPLQPFAHFEHVSSACHTGTILP